MNERPAALIVDDDPGVRDMLTAILKRDGWDVDPVSDGQSALERLAQRSYVVVVLDLLMPRLSGGEVITEMRRRNIGTPVIVLSAYSGEQGHQLDPTIVRVAMQKPIQLADLRTVVRAIKDTHQRNTGGS